MKSRTDESNRADIKASKKLLIQSSIYLLAAVILLAFASYAWFVSNRRVTVNNTNVAAKGDEFNLFVVGDEGVYDSRYKPAMTHGTASDRVTKAGETVSGEETINVKDIEWLMSSEGNIKNCSLDEAGNVILNPEAYEIEPGSFGRLVFYVVPLADGDLTVNFSVALTMFSQSYAVSEPASGQYIAEPTGISDTYRYYPEIENAELLKLLSGHLMFFENRSVRNGQFVYSDRITEGCFTKTFEGAKEGVLEEVNLYWVWPYVLGQTLLPAGDKNLGNYNRIFADYDSIDDIDTDNIDESDSDYDAKLFLKELTCTDEDASVNYKNYFYRMTGEDNLDNLEKVRECILRGSGDPSFDSEVFGSLSTYWNRADQYVGINVSYISLEIIAY